jgi:putative transposase
MSMLSFRYRIYPNKAQTALLSEMLGDFCQLYNAALEHRIAAYRRGMTVGFYDQSAALVEIRRDLEDQGRWSSTAQRQVLRRLDKAYRAFFGRVKRGAKPGFPRFRSRDRYHAADFRVGGGLTIRESGKLRFVGVEGLIKVRWHRELPGKPKSAILSRTALGWFIVFHVEVAPVERASTDSVGIDLGLTSLVALSNGEHIACRNITKRNARKLRVRQRALSRSKLDSKVRQKRRAAVAKLHAHIANARRDNLHKIAASIVSRFGRIAIENLEVRKIIVSETSPSLAKDVHDAAWSTLTGMLAYKAERAGCELVKVEPVDTCPQGQVAAAIAVHQRAFGLPAGNAGGSPSQPLAA